MAVQVNNPRPFALDRTISISWAHILFLVATLLRVALIAIPSHGYDSFAYRHWTWRLVHEPLSRFYVDDGQVFPDHLPGDLWLFKLMGEGARFVHPGFDFYGPTYGVMISLLATGFDALLAVSLFHIGNSLGRRQAGKAIALLYWCAPAPIFVASVWGQVDAIASTLAVISLGLAINRRFTLAFLVLTLCVVVKPQFGLLALPLLAAWWHQDHSLPLAWLRRVSTTAIACLALLTGIIAPFGLSLVGGWGSWSFLERIQLAADTYPVTSLGAHNIWIVAQPFAWPARDNVPILFGMSSQIIGYGLFAMVILITSWLLIRHWQGPITMVLASNILMFGFFLVTTRMHERYLFPVVALSLLLALMDHRYRWYAGTVGLIVFANIALRFVWPVNDDWTGWHYLIGFGWLEQAWFVQLLVVISIGTFVWLINEGMRPKSLDT